MSIFTKQMRYWAGDFGKQYTDRNFMTLDEMELLFKNNYGFTRSEINQRFLMNMDLSVRILEVGSNIGNQLLCLQKAGFNNLYGIELQSYAVELSKSRTKNINIIQGSAFDIPFKDGFFDIVFTSGVLIHIAPEDISGVLEEICRCSKRYIWGTEYYSGEYEEVNYRGNEKLLWKNDFSKMFLNKFSDLRLVKVEYLKYLNNDNVDIIYLIEKK